MLHIKAHHSQGHIERGGIPITPTRINPMANNCFHAGKKPNMSGARTTYDQGKTVHTTGVKVTYDAGKSSGTDRGGAEQGAPAMGKGKK
jgi:hypothetical protein